MHKHTRTLLPQFQLYIAEESRLFAHCLFPVCSPPDDSWSRIPVVEKPSPPDAPGAPSTGPKFAPTGGRSSNFELPFFAVYGSVGGHVFSIGYSGSWEAGIYHHSREQGQEEEEESAAAAAGVTVSVTHPTLCASLAPGEIPLPFITSSQKKGINRCVHRRTHSDPLP